MVFTFFSRNTGQGVRISLLPGVLEPSARHMELIDKIRKKTATHIEKEEFEKLHIRRTTDILETPTEKLFRIENTELETPEKAKIEPSKPCEKCGEPTMPSKMMLSGGKMICRGCIDL
jgi:formylmethanofuran dehydrogenase subunit E